MRPARVGATVWLLASVLAGCFRTTIVVQGGSGTVPVSHDEIAHHAIVYGLAELSAPYDLDRICPGGTVRVHSETTFLGGLVQAMTLSLYNPQEITIECVSGPAALAAPESEAPATTARAPEPASGPAPAAAPTPLPPPAYVDPPPPPPAE